MTAVSELAASFSGQVIRAGDPEYDDARKVWNGCFDDRRPALIARSATVADVQAMVNYARERGMEVAVRGGAHSAQGFGTWDDAVVIDLAPMKSIEIDPQTRVVEAEAGLTWAEFDAATQEHGLAITGGRISSTGIAGLTLGSGSGWLERRCGLTADNLVSAEVVTADGRAVTASAEENPDLFWGLRGGSGNFGIVTSFTFRAHEIGPIIFGGMMISLPDRAVEVLRFLRGYMENAPDDFSCTPAFIGAPPAPDVPAALHFAPVLAMVVNWTGPLEDGERMLAPVREVAQPVMEHVGPMPYAALQLMLDPASPKGTRAYLKAELLGELSDQAIDKLVRHGSSRSSPMSQLIIEPMGGAISRVAPDGTALGSRDAKWVFHAIAQWIDPSEDEIHIAWGRDLAADLAPNTADGVYLNFTSDAGEDRVRSAYGAERYARLVALKDKYDPTNLFHLNQNIAPSPQ